MLSAVAAAIGRRTRGIGLKERTECILCRRTAEKDPINEEWVETGNELGARSAKAGERVDLIAMVKKERNEMGPERDVRRRRGVFQ